MQQNIGPSPSRRASRLSALAVSGYAFAACVVLGSLPALAETPIRYDGEDPGDGYTAIQNITYFVLIPLGMIALIFLAVYGASWTRSGRSTSASFSDAPVSLSSPAATMVSPSGPGIEAPKGPTDHTEPGGASAKW